MTYDYEFLIVLKLAVVRIVNSFKSDHGLPLDSTSGARIFD
jgi:hypothetical protein